MKTTKKALSILLSLLLALGAVAVGGVSASALDVRALLEIGGETAILDGDILQREGTGWSITETENGVTLNFNNPDLTYDGNCIYAYYLDLTITGSAKLTSNDDNVIRLYKGNLTLNGDFTLTSQNVYDSALYVNGNLTVEGGSLSVINTAGDAISLGGSITVNGGSVYAKTESSSDRAILAAEIILNNGEDFALGDRDAKEVLIKALAVLAADARLSIGNDTAINNGDIEQRAGTGWSITRNENGVTLILDNPDLTYNGCCIYARHLDLTITGSAKLTATKTTSGAIDVNEGNLTLNGDFTLTSQCWDGGLIVYGNLTVEGGSLSVINTANCAIYANDTMTVNGGSVYAKTESSSYSAISAGEIILNNGEAFALGDEDAKEVLIKVTGTLAGKGTEISPYMIFDYTDLKLFASKVNGGETGAHAKLMKDIDASASAGANDWTPIGDGSGSGDSQIKYTGTFDGDGHIITGLSNEEVTDAPNYAGLFGYVGTKTEGGVTTKGTVKNVGLEGGSITGNDNVGGVVGLNYGGTVTNCYNTGSVTATEQYAYAGGVVGYNNNNSSVENCYNTGSVTATEQYAFVGGVVGYNNNNSSVENCYNTGAVSGSVYVGGVVGYNYNSKVSNCYNTGGVTATGSNAHAGGVAGFNNDSSSVKNCYNTGSVTAQGSDAYAGGVVGYNYSNSTISNCYNTGDVSGNYYSVGGVVGYNYNSKVSNCYNTGSVTSTASNSHAGGVVGDNIIDSSVENCYNTGAVSGNDFVGGVAGRNWDNSTVSNCYYDSDRAPAIPAIGYEDSATHTNVEGLTTAQMTGESALRNMVFEFGAGEVSPWQTKANGADVSGKYFLFYPHLKGFDYDLTAASEDWPAKVEVSATWSGEYSYTYDGSAHVPTVVNVTVGDTSVPAGVDATYSQYTYSDDNNKWEWKNILVSPTNPGKYKMEIRDGDEVIVTKYFIILDPGADYTVSYSDAAGNPASPVNADKYKAIVTFTDTGYLKGQPPIEKAFNIEPKPVAVTACGPDGPTKAYNGQEQSYKGSVIWIYDREETGLDDSKLRYTGNTTVTGTDAGRHSVDLSADCCVCDDSNYDVTFTAEGDFDFYISVSVLTVTADNQETDYGENLAGLTYKIEPRFGSYYNTDELGITLRTDADKNKAGTYDITVTVPDNPNYLITTQKGTYTVRQIDPVATVTAEDIDYGQKAVVTFTAPADATGKVTFYLDAADTGITKDIENGQAVCEFEKLNIGSHSVECVYTGDGNFKPGETKTAGFEVKSVDCPLTVNYVYADGSEAAETFTDNVAIFTQYSVTSPGITGYAPDTATVEGTMGDDDMGGKTVTVKYSPVEYTATFVDENGETVKEIPYTVETKSIKDKEPEVPEKQGYTGKWEEYELAVDGVTVKPEYTAIEYTATFVADGKTAGEVKFTVETEKLKEPAVPVKEGYEGKWSGYTIAASDMTVNAEYTAIEYKATFVADGKTVAEIPYTVETKSIEAPAVPEKEGYTGEWEEYELAAGGVTVNAVYTEIDNPDEPDEPESEDLCPLDEKDHGTSFWGKLIRFIHTVIYKLFKLFGLNVYFRINHNA